ncbi:glycoside hydrolase [Membranicola marinus]|uniref:exo-alpha-sialidase n=1 Tax=Membranihabitans marinus TaxID=1227546 RepID=A0A953L9X5_9BACT|nr:sialidase family protein [Membranihabitans marinus]MBY5959295.1 glycoside hydrolase [Membranihabitans marinus]
MRHLLLLFAVVLMMIACSRKGTSLKSESKPELSEFHDLFVAAENPDVECYRIPAIVTAPNGDLIAAIDERVPGCADLRGSRDINIVLRRSMDNGDSWTDIQTVVDFPDGKSASDPSMIVDEETGEVFMFYNYMDLDKEKDVYYLHVVKSSDNGNTWSEPFDITDQITKAEWHNDFKFITSGRGIQTKDGWLLHTLVNLKNGLHIFGSKDHGASWFLIDTPIEVGDESKIIQLDNGDWMINSRVNQGGRRYVHVSDDQGQSWTSRPANQLTDPGNNAGIIRYSSKSAGDDQNRLLFCNTNSEKGRKNLTIRISYDEGKTWSDGKVIYPGSAAYSSITILENGEIGVFFERDDYSRNTFVKFPIEWVK